MGTEHTFLLFLSLVIPIIPVKTYYCRQLKEFSSSFQELTNSITETAQELINSFTVRELTLKYSFVTSLFKTILLSFLCYYRNVNPIMIIFRDGKFSTHHSRLFSIPHSWFSSCGKIKIPHSRLCRSWGIFISPRLLNHSWGIGNCLL